MSGLLAGMVWQSALDSRLKPLAACLAGFANDQGDGVHPSNDYLRWLLGWGESTIRSGMTSLKKMGILIPVENELGGRGRFPLYHFEISELPKRASWSQVRGSQTLDFSGSEERVQKTTPKGARNRAEKGPENDQRNKEETLEETLEESSPLFAEGVRPASEVKGPDPRHSQFKELIFRFYQWKWKRKPGWDGSDAAQLSRVLKANPELTAETFAVWLKNYGQSKNIAPGERPRRFLPRIENYSVRPLNQFGRDGSESVNGKPGPAQERTNRIADRAKRYAATQGISVEQTSQLASGDPEGDQ